ncbi:MAG: DUF6178 family protein [Myxococcota bacterium]
MAEHNPPISISEVSGPSLLRLARASRAAAVRKLRGLDPESQARACLELRPEVRSEFLMLLDHPEQVVPLFPDPAVCMTVRASGMEAGAWLLEMATPEQRQTCFDLDCWSGPSLQLSRVGEWVDALLEVGPETVARAVGETDLELWILMLRDQASLQVLAKEEVPPLGALTVDGVVYFIPREGVDPSRVEKVARALVAHAPADYWRWVYGVLFESPTELEEQALRWRSGRLADLGFPEREQALGVYARLRPDDAPVWELGEPGSAVVPSGSIPRQLEGSRVGEALQRLPPDAASAVLRRILALTNAVAVADDLVLSEANAIPKALEKAVRGVDAGLLEAARVQDRPLEEILVTTLPFDLFRIGATGDPTLRKVWRDPFDDEDDRSEGEG